MNSEASKRTTNITTFSSPTRQAKSTTAGMRSNLQKTNLRNGVSNRPFTAITFALNFSIAVSINAKLLVWRTSIWSRVKPWESLNYGQFHWEEEPRIDIMWPDIYSNCIDASTSDLPKIQHAPNKSRVYTQYRRTQCFWHTRACAHQLWDFHYLIKSSHFYSFKFNCVHNRFIHLKMLVDWLSSVCMRDNRFFAHYAYEFTKNDSIWMEIYSQRMI